MVLFEGSVVANVRPIPDALTIVHDHDNLISPYLAAVHVECCPLIQRMPKSAGGLLRHHSDPFDRMLMVPHRSKFQA